MKSDPKVFQNVTTPRQNSTTVLNVTVNTTFVQTVNVTRFNFSCNCANSRFSRLSQNNAPVNESVCGCDASANPLNQTCQCCVPRSYSDELFYSNLTCTINTSVSECQCAPGRNTSCNCTATGQRAVFRNIALDTQSRCQCMNNTAGTQSCRCCVAPQASLIPRAVCNASITNSVSATCRDVYSTIQNRTVLSCQWSTTTFTN